MLKNDSLKNDETKNSLLSDKITIKDVVAALLVNDARTALRWCKRKGILVIKFGKEKYVNIIDFQLAVDRPFIESLKVKYPQNWKEMYDAYKKGDFITIAEQMLQDSPVAKVKFVVQGDAANNFLMKMKQKRKNNG